MMINKRCRWYINGAGYNYTVSCSRHEKKNYSLILYSERQSVCQYRDEANIKRSRKEWSIVRPCHCQRHKDTNSQGLESVHAHCDLFQSSNPLPNAQRAVPHTFWFAGFSPALDVKKRQSQQTTKQSNAHGTKHHHNPTSLTTSIHQSVYWCFPTREIQAMRTHQRGNPLRNQPCIWHLKTGLSRL